MQKSILSNKVAETFSFEGDNIIIKKTFDAAPMLADAKHAREVTENSFGSDYKHVGIWACLPCGSRRLVYRGMIPPQSKTS